MKNVLLIYTCSKNADRRAAIESTWLSRVNIPWYYVVTTGDNLEPSVKIDCPETYESLGVKTYRVLEWFVRSEFDRMIKVDDDTYINSDKLNNLQLSHDYCGFMIKSLLTPTKYHYGKCTDDQLNKTPIVYDIQDYQFAAGGCYSLSKKAAKICIDNINVDEMISTDRAILTLEDRMIGKCLRCHDVTTNSSGSWISRKTNRYSVFNETAFHSVDSVKMKTINCCNFTTIHYNKMYIE